MLISSCYDLLSLCDMHITNVSCELENVICSFSSTVESGIGKTNWICDSINPPSPRPFQAAQSPKGDSHKPISIVCLLLNAAKLT